MKTIQLDSYNIEELDNLNIPLIEPLKELKAASNAYQRMTDTGVGSFHQYDRHWRDFLHSLDRFWNKLVAACEGQQHWPRFKSKFGHLRKKDELLLYLVQARNVSEHSISQVVKDWSADLKADSVAGGIRLSWNPWDRPLLSVVCRGVTYNPPRRHLGKPISYYREQRAQVEEPRVVAELAMKFYVEVFNEVNSKLFHP